MPNERRRCALCDQRVPAGQMIRYGLSWVCGPACLEANRGDEIRRVRAKALAKIAGDRQRELISHAKSPRADISPSQKKRIRARDRGRCRWCGTADGVQVHHIEYRSQGGGHEGWNLICLCDEHHRTVHSDKGRYQPLLRGVIWMIYVQKVSVTVPQLERWLRDGRDLTVMGPSPAVTAV